MLDKTNNGTPLTAAVFLLLSCAVAFVSANSFNAMREPKSSIDAVRPQPQFKSVMLSGYFEGIKNTPADTPVYIQNGDTPGGTVLLLCGCHSNEPASSLAAVLFLENSRVRQGRLIVVPYANPMGRSHTMAQEGHPQFFHISQPGGGIRSFRYGARITNPIHEWPNPDIYIHPASGQQLAGCERSNLNRCYPGKPDGAITERLAYAIVELIRKEKVDLAFDLHEASPEYPVVNAIVAGEKAMELSAMAMMELESLNIPMRLEPSPRQLRGLSHREWGENTDVAAVLMETANPSMGRFRGKTDEDLILTGKDKAYELAGRLGQLFVPFDSEGQSLDLRVARHVGTVKVILEMLGLVQAERAVVLENVPGFDEIIADGLGAHLAVLDAPEGERE